MTADDNKITYENYDYRQNAGGQGKEEGNAGAKRVGDEEAG